ncbi:MAG: hypothetical protein IPN71_00480 [Fibrobacteres bacterium]|jgi:hypothetical protein|nr:hypothetical protein [Fibrobacterota bacterium]
MSRSIHACILGLSGFAIAGMSIPVESGLADLLSTSSNIVVAVKDKPAESIAAIRLGGKSKEPWKYGFRRFRVLAKIRSGMSDSVKQIKVIDADLGTLEQIESEGLSKSFYSESFAPGRGLLDTRDTLILFLGNSNQRGEYPLMAEDACLPPARAGDIRTLLNSSP